MSNALIEKAFEKWFSKSNWNKCMNICAKDAWNACAMLMADRVKELEAEIKELKDRVKSLQGVIKLYTNEVEL